MILQYMANVLASPTVTRRFSPFSALFAKQLHHILNKCQRVFGEWCTAADGFQYASPLSSTKIATSYYAQALQAIYQFETNVVNLAQVNMELQRPPITYVPPLAMATAKRPRTDTGAAAAETGQRLQRPQPPLTSII